MSCRKPHFRTSKVNSGSTDQHLEASEDKKKLPMPKWTRTLLRKLKPKKKAHKPSESLKIVSLEREQPPPTNDQPSNLQVHQQPPFECSCSDLLKDCNDRSSLLLLDETIDSSLQENWDPMTCLQGTALLFIKSQAAGQKLELSPWNSCAESSAVEEILKCKDPYDLEGMELYRERWDRSWESAKLGMSRWINYSVPCSGLCIPCSSLQTLTHFDPQNHYVLTMRTHFRSLPKGLENFLKMETIFCCSRVGEQKMRFRVYWRGILHPKAPWTVRGTSSVDSYLILNLQKNSHCIFAIERPNSRNVFITGPTNS
jgi:hypothetical protein